MKRRISAFLLAAMLLGLTACAGDPSAADTTLPPADDSTDPAETAPIDALPTVNYDGAEFNILIPADVTYEYSLEINGDIVGDAEYNRDRTLEEKYNITLNYIAQPGNWAYRDTFNGLIRQSIMSNDGAYDLVNGLIAVTMPLVSEGLFLNYLELEDMNLADPWWAAEMDKNLSFCGKLYGVCGSGLLSMYKSSYVMYYNEKLVTDYKLENPLQLVLDGSWTVDKFLALTKDFTNDLNADSLIDTDDQIGYIANEVCQRGFQTALALNPLSKDPDGYFVFTGLTERFTGAADKLSGYLSDKSQCLIRGTELDELTAMFINNQALFYTSTIQTIESLRNMESDFGLIPQPKLDENQEDYHVQMGTGSGMYFIPKTVKDPGMTVNVLNAYNCLSMSDVVPAYYESSLKEKFTRSDENKLVIDIINRSIMMDASFAFATTLGGSPNTNTFFYFATVFSLPSASMFESNRSTIEAGIEALEEAFSAIE